MPLPSKACIVSLAPGDAEEVASTVNRDLVVRYSTRLIETVSDAVGLTVMLTVAGPEDVPLLLVTTNWNVRTVDGPGGTTGAVKVGFAAVLLERATAVPAVCVHMYVSAEPPESLLDVPSSVTTEPEETDWPGPAFAVGVPGMGQLAGVGTGEPGQGLSCPTSGPVPFNGPEPCARKGKSSKLFGTIGVPTFAFSGNRNSKIGA